MHTYAILGNIIHIVCFSKVFGVKGVFGFIALFGLVVKTATDERQ